MATQAIELIFCVYNIQGRTNLPPEKVPWETFRTLLSQCIYGGKIDNEFDQVCGNFRKAGWAFEFDSHVLISWETIH